MKYSAPFVLILLGLFLGGCAREAWYADREFGIASSNAFDQQVVHKDYKYAGLPVEGLESLYLENTMSRYLETFEEGFTEEDIDITSTGASSGSNTSD